VFYVLFCTPFIFHFVPSPFVVYSLSSIYDFWLPLGIFKTFLSGQLIKNVESASIQNIALESHLVFHTGLTSIVVSFSCIFNNACLSLFSESYSVIPLRKVSGTVCGETWVIAQIEKGKYALQFLFCYSFYEEFGYTGIFVVIYLFIYSRRKCNSNCSFVYLFKHLYLYLYHQDIFLLKLKKKN
jgi:hypothetical protein